MQELPPHLKMLLEDPNVDPAFLMAVAAQRIEGIRADMAQSNHPAFTAMGQGLYRLTEAIHWLNYCKAIQKQVNAPGIIKASADILN